MQRRTLLLVLALVLALGAGVGVGLAVSGDDGARRTTTTSSSTTSTTSTPAAPCAVQGATVVTQSVLVPEAPTAHLHSVEATSVERCDVVVFSFRPGSGGVPTVPSVEVGYRPGPVTAAPSDEPLAVPGTAFLFVRLFAASCHDLDAPGFPRTCVTPDPSTPAGTAHVLQARVVEDFEAQLTWVLGLDTERPFTLATDPAAGTVTVTIA